MKPLSSRHSRQWITVIASYNMMIIKNQAKHTHIVVKVKNNDGEYDFLGNLNV